MWQNYLIIGSAVLLFGFVALGIKVFGLLSCYSAYGPLWGEKCKIPGGANIWSIVTILSALLMVPVLLDCGENNPYQFLGFLAPVFLTLVGITPNYQTNKLANVLHQIGAWGSVLLIVAYCLLIPKIIWPVIALAVTGLIIGLIIRGTLLLWLEMAVYMSIYVILAYLVNFL